MKIHLFMYITILPGFHYVLKRIWWSRLHGLVNLMNSDTLFIYFDLLLENDFKMCNRNTLNESSAYFFMAVITFLFFILLRPGPTCSEHC